MESTDITMILSTVWHRALDLETHSEKTWCSPRVCTTRIITEAEAGCTLGSQKYVGSRGKIIGIDRFGASASGGKIFEEYGNTLENVITVARSL